ncbi:MAG: hypothetical protein V1750_04275 [Acidobacteriota bacterium]
MMPEPQGLEAAPALPPGWTWRAFDPEQPLFSLHVPKCAGQSLRVILQERFGPNLLVHYFQQHEAPPPRHDATGPVCIHGHFNHVRGWGIDQYYPGAEQLLTVLRHPLEQMVSNYFFWKARQRETPRGQRAYRTITEFFEQRRTAPMLPFLPACTNHENFKEVLSRRFIWIGLVENLEHSLPWLGHVLGRRGPSIPHANASPRDEELPAEVAERFAANNALEYAIFHWVQESWRAIPVLGPNES